MPLYIIKKDITKLSCDAIVNAANRSLLGGGGVDGAIHNAAGGELLAECRTLGGCGTGEAKLTKGYKLPCKYVIHTVGPVWRGGAYGEEELLRACYRNSLSLAAKHGFESVAFPLISAGVYGYPKDSALSVAAEEISAFLQNYDMTVYIVIYNKSDYIIDGGIISVVSAYIKENLAADLPVFESAETCAFSEKKVGKARMPAREKPVFFTGAALSVGSSLDDALNNLDESFSQMLLRKIDEKGMTDSQCYKRANVDRKHFSKIRANRMYRPSKTTAIAFAIALRLSLEETKELLMKAGFALSHSNKFDIIIEYFITNNIYDIFTINETLFAFDQALLGA